MEKDKTTQEDFLKLKSVWESNKDKVQRDDEHEYIIFNEHDLRDAGVSSANLKAPGNFTTDPNRGNEKRYFLREFGRGRFKLFKGF